MQHFLHIFIIAVSQRKLIGKGLAFNKAKYQVVTFPWYTEQSAVFPTFVILA